MFFPSHIAFKKEAYAYETMTILASESSIVYEVREMDKLSIPEQQHFLLSKWPVEQLYSQIPDLPSWLLLLRLSRSYQPIVDVQDFQKLLRAGYRNKHIRYFLQQYDYYTILRFSINLNIPVQLN